jgi:hypothetical protein
MARPKKSQQAPVSVSSEPQIDSNAFPRETVVKPYIRVKGQPHRFEELDAQNKLPELTSIGLCKVSGLDEGRRNDWISYVLKTRGREIISLEVSEPDHKAIAEDNCKTIFVNLFMNQEGLL